MSKTKKTVIGVIILLVLIYLGYKWYQKKQASTTLANPPAVIKRLANGQLMTTSNAAPVYGCYGGVRYIKTTQGTGGWQYVGTYCAAGDMQIV